MRQPPLASRFYTIDPSDFVDGNADDYGEQMLRERFAAIRAENRMGRELRQPPSSAAEWPRRSRSMSRRPCGCAVKYGRALEHAIGLAQVHSPSERCGGPAVRAGAEHRRNAAAHFAGRALHHCQRVSQPRRGADQLGPAVSSASSKKAWITKATSSNWSGRSPIMRFWRANWAPTN